MINTKFAFLTSSRFYALVIGAVMFYLKAKGWVGESEMILANTILAGFITIKTIDRASEQKVLAAGVTSGTVDVASVASIPTQE